MNLDRLAPVQGISIIILFLIGSTLFIGGTGEAGNDSWIATLLAIALSVPLYACFARLAWLYPGKNLFDMLESAFGKAVGKLVSLLYVWYAFHLGAMVLRNFGEFTKSVTLTETPMFVPMLSIGLVCIWVTRLGIDVFGRSAQLLMVFVVLVVGLVQVLSVPLWDALYLKPVMAEGFMPIFSSSTSIFAFPFAEIVLLMAVFHTFNHKRVAWNVLWKGLLVAGPIILLIDLRNVMVLGADLLSGLYFPSYVAVSRINVGDFLQRIEGSVAILFVMAIFVKIGLCMLAACIGLQRVFNLSDIKVVAFPLGLLMIYYAMIVFVNIMDMHVFAYASYKYYAFPFQVLIPLVLWVTSEIKWMRSRKSTVKASQTA